MEEVGRKGALKKRSTLNRCSSVLAATRLPQPETADWFHKKNKDKKQCAGVCDQLKMQAASTVACFCLSDRPRTLRGPISLTRPPEIIS